MTMTSAADVAVRDWELERYRLGELSREQRERIDVLLAADAGLRARLADLDAADVALLAQCPPKVFAAQVREREQRVGARPWTHHPRLVLGWAGAAAAVVLVAGVFLASRETQKPGDGDRIKGLRPHVLLFRKTAEGAERLAPTSRVRARDVIQVVYQAAGRRFGVIVSVDARGVVTRHLPATGTQSAELQPGTVALPAAYQLDDAPRWECFYLVTSNAPFDVAVVVDAARQPSGAGARVPAKRLDVPAQLDQEVFVLRKEES
jgi:hypothetical protein